MAKKKIYKHHQRSTLAAAKADAVARELVLAGGAYQAGVKFEDGTFLTLNQTADVRTYGAVADGITDDSAAFAAAIATGLRVYVPAGTYAIASTITIANKQGFVMSGDGIAKTALVWTGAAGGTMVRMRGSWFSKIEGLWLNMNSLADVALDIPCYAPGVDTYVVMFNEIEHVRMDNARTGATSVALKIGDTTGQQIDNLTIKKCFIANAARLVTIQGNVTFHIHFVDCEFSGYVVQPTEVFVDLLDRCALIYFTGCQFVGYAPTVGIIRRDTISGSVVFNNCETENAGTWFVGVEDSSFVNSWPVQMIGCTVGCSCEDVTMVYSITNGSPTATYVSGDTRQLAVGRMVTGTGIPSNTRITAVDSSNNLTLSNNATATGASTSVTLWPNANVVSLNSTTTVTVTDLSKFRKGKEIWGTGIPSTTVSSFIANTSITMSAVATRTDSAADVYIDGTHFTVGMTYGSAVLTCSDTTGVANGQRCSGSGVTSTTITALSATTGAGTITISAAATATDSAALVHMKPNTIDYQQRGVFMISGGTLSGLVETDAYFGAPGSVGAIGGLVTEVGGRYLNGAIAFVTAYASQLHRTNRKGDISFGPHMTINGATGNVAITGYTSIGGALDVTGNLSGANITAAGASTPTAVLSRTAAAASADEVANVKSTSLNASGISRDMSEFVTKVDDATNTSEDSSFLLKLFRAGVKKTVAVLQGTGILTVTGANQGGVVVARENIVGATSEPGVWQVTAPNGSGNARTWSNIRTVVDDGTEGSEDSSLHVTLQAAGSAVDAAIINADGVNLLGANLQLSTQRTPASASATGTKGQICHDTSYIYVCTATNTWKRVAIATW